MDLAPGGGPMVETDNRSAGTVTVRLFASARAAAGTREIRVAPGTTSEVVAVLVEALPDPFREVLSVSSLVSDGHRLDHCSPTPIAAGAVIDVLPPFAGG